MHGLSPSGSSAKPSLAAGGEALVAGHGVGIDAQEDVAQHLGLVDVVVAVQLLQVGNEVGRLLGSVAVLVAALGVEQVVGNVVVGREPVGSYDAAVEQLGHLSMIVGAGAVVELHELVVPQGTPYREMHLSLGLHDAGDDAGEVLAGLLDIFLGARHVELYGLEHVAGLPLVAHGHGHDVQLLESLDFVLRVAHAKHLDDALVGRVVAVFGAAVALSNPHRVVQAGHGIAYIVGQVHAREIEVLHVAASLHAKHLVALAQVDHELALHQVGSKCDLAGVVAVGEQHVLQQRGVEHDVAVVAHKEVAASWLDVAGAVAGERGDGVGNDALVGYPHHLVLEVVDGAKREHHVAHLLRGQVGENISCQEREKIVAHNAVHGRGYLAVGVGAYVVVILHIGACVVVLAV